MIERFQYGFNDYSSCRLLHISVLWIDIEPVPIAH